MMRSTILNAALQGSCEDANLRYLVEKHAGVLFLLNERGETLAQEYMRLRPGPQERRTAMLLAPPFVLPWLLPSWFLEIGAWDEMEIDWTC
jgi:hypothetical protein